MGTGNRQRIRGGTVSRSAERVRSFKLTGAVNDSDHPKGRAQERAADK